MQRFEILEARKTPHRGFEVLDSEVIEAQDKKAALMMAFIRAIFQAGKEAQLEGEHIRLPDGIVHVIREVEDEEESVAHRQLALF